MEETNRETHIQTLWILDLINREADSVKMCVLQRGQCQKDRSHISAIKHKTPSFLQESKELLVSLLGVENPRLTLHFSRLRDNMHISRHIILFHLDLEFDSILD